MAEILTILMNEMKLILVILAESALDGFPYVSSTSNSQPRVGSATCQSCDPGTLADQNGQRYDDLSFPSVLIPSSSVVLRVLD